MGERKEALRVLNEVGAELRRVPVLLEVAAAQAQSGEDEVDLPGREREQTTHPNACRKRALMGYAQGERLGIPQMLRAIPEETDPESEGRRGNPSTTSSPPWPSWASRFRGRQVARSASPRWPPSSWSIPSTGRASSGPTIPPTGTA